MTKDSTEELVKHIAEQLGETSKQPIGQIRNLVRIAGADFVSFMADNAQIIDENGGMVVADGSRKRTRGGVFFFLIRGALPKDMREKAFPVYGRRPRKIDTSLPIFQWDQRVEQLKKVHSRKGKVEEVRIYLRGTPGHIEKTQEVYILSMEQEAEAESSMPRGLPDVPVVTTTYTVYVGSEQWKKNVGKKLKNPEVELNIEGLGFFDPDTESMTVFAQSIKVKTKKKKPEPPAEEDNKAAKAQDEAAQQDGEETPDLSTFPPEIAQKLRPLYSARTMFRKRLADIEAKPADQQSGLKAAKMMVERTEKQIQELIAQAKG